MGPPELALPTISPVDGVMGDDREASRFADAPGNGGPVDREKDRKRSLASSVGLTRGDVAQGDAGCVAAAAPTIGSEISQDQVAEVSLGVEIHLQHFGQGVDAHRHQRSG